MEMQGRLVIVGTELAGGGEPALDEAYRWANRWRSGLLVVHVIDESADVRDLRVADAAARGEPETPRAVGAALAEIVERLQGGGGVEISTEVASGAPSIELCKIAEARSAGLVVIGATGRATIPRIGLGNVSERVVRFAGCPVLVVRGGSEGPILAATDFSDDSLPAARAASLVASLSGTTPLFLHCLEEPPNALHSAAHKLLSRAEAAVVLSRADAERFLSDAALAIAPAAERIVVEGDAARTIVRFAAERGCSLVVVGARGRTGMARIVLGSVAEEVVRDAPCSVLVVRLVAG